jgi:demethylphylloquinol methyltransferase
MTTAAATDNASASAPEVQALFNRIAPVYDRLNTQLSFGLHWIWKGMAVEWAGARPGSRMLDLCCGSGDLAMLLGRAVGQTGLVYGVDFATELLAVAAQRSAKRYPPLPIKWHWGDALALDFPDSFFEGATMGYGLRNVADIPQALRELHRVLKPGGKAAILDMHQPDARPVRSFQAWFLERQVVPRATALGVRSDYEYINPSIERFPRGPEQVQLALEAGFTKAVHHPLAMGMMGILVVQR